MTGRDLGSAGAAMSHASSYRYLVVIIAHGLMTLALSASSAHAEVSRTGDEPWYRQPAVDIDRAQDLFIQGIEAHQQLLFGDARELYDQALALWDNPDIRWNLALVLEGLGQYLRAHHELENVHRWGQALGAERLQDVRDRMAALETHRLVGIEASCDEPATDIMLDGQLWFRAPGRQRILVDPGDHSVVAHKAGFFPVSRSILVVAGQVARLDLPMDVDRRIETRRWSAWTPWIPVSAGLVLAATGTVFDHEALLHRESAERSLGATCGKKAECEPVKNPGNYRQAITENRIAIGAFVVGGATTAIGLVLRLINQVQVRRSEARPLGPIEIVPVLSTNQVGVFAQRQF